MMPIVSYIRHSKPSQTPQLYASDRPLLSFYHTSLPKRREEKKLVFEPKESKKKKGKKIA